MSNVDPDILRLIQERTYGARPAPWNGMPSRVRTGAATPRFTPRPAVNPTLPRSPLGAAMNVGRTTPNPTPPLGIPATTTTGTGTGRPLASSIPTAPRTLPSSGQPIAMPTPPNPGYAGPVPAGSGLASLPPGAAPAAAAGRTGVLAGLGGAGRFALTGARGPILAAGTLGAMSAGAANEGTHPYTNIPVIGGLADTSGDSVSDQFREGMAFLGPTGGALNVAVGGLQNLFGGGGDGGGDGESDEEAPEGIHKMLAVFDQSAAAGMMDPALRNQYAAVYNMLLTSAGNSPENREAAATEVISMITQQAMANMTATQSQIQVPTPEDILAQQANVAQIVRPYVEDMQANAAARNGVLQGMIGDLPAEFQGSMQAGVLGMGLAQDQAVNAIGLQMALSPQAIVYEQMQQQQNAIASQLQQQAVQNLLNPPQAAAGGLSLDDLLAQQSAG